MVWMYVWILQAHGAKGRLTEFISGRSKLVLPMPPSIVAALLTQVGSTAHHSLGRQASCRSLAHSLVWSFDCLAAPQGDSNWKRIRESFAVSAEVDKVRVSPPLPPTCFMIPRPSLPSLLTSSFLLVCLPVWLQVNSAVVVQGPVSGVSKAKDYVFGLLEVLPTNHTLLLCSQSRPPSSRLTHVPLSLPAL